MEGNYDTAHFLDARMEGEWTYSPLIMYKNKI
jgi:hypothetical protein